MTSRSVLVTVEQRDTLEDALKRRSLGWDLTFEHYRVIRELVQTFDEAAVEEGEAA